MFDQTLHERQFPQHATIPIENRIMITNVRLPYVDKEQATKLWTVECLGARVSKILPTSDNGWHENSTATYEARGFEAHVSRIDARGGLMLPSFCHSHIHLDKCFILDRCGDLIEGDFAEAMRVTKVAKAEFPSRADDLYARGARIIRESVEYGVTVMRAHVEVDTSVGFACLETAQKLQDDYRAQCDIQIAVFAQEPLFSSPDDVIAGPNFSLLKDATLRHGVTVIGSAPYVEPTLEQVKMNIGLIFDIADVCNVNYVDFHLDYNLDPSSDLLIYEVIAQLKRRYERSKSSSPSDPDPESSRKGLGKVPRRTCPRITIGHATRLQLLTSTQWRDLVDAISDLPITFVGLPQSDIFMQGRDFKDTPLGAPRGTLRVPYIAKNYGVQIAMSVNNVDNAFTPQGSLDPLSLCTFGVAVFQTATPEDIRTLVRSVTLTSKSAIGTSQETSGESNSDLTPNVGDLADFVILHGSETLQSAVLNPCYDRTTIKGGRIISWRRSTTWFLS